MSATDEQKLFQDAVLGVEAEAFLDSAVGRRMTLKTKAIEEEAIEELIDVSPSDKEKITALQNVIWKCRTFRDFIAEMIYEGNNAEEQLREAEEAGSPEPGEE